MQERTRRMSEKGVIDTKNIKSQQAFNMINEFLEKVTKDSLNIKDSELNAVKELISKIQKNYYTYRRLHNFIKPVMSPKQKDDYITLLENE